MIKNVRVVDLPPQRAHEAGRMAAMLCRLGGRGENTMTAVPTYRANGSLTPAAAAYLVGTWAITAAGDE